MRFVPWGGGERTGWTVLTETGGEVGDIWDTSPGVFKFFHTSEAYDPAPITAVGLRHIADKLDELNVQAGV